MKQKGFTLIELLAVIVILAIIALIATPMILGVIALLDDEATGSSTIAADTYTTSSNGKTLTATDGTTLTVTFKGDAPEDGSTVTVGSDGVITSAKLGFKGIYAYWVNYDGNKATVGTDKIS